MRRYCEFTGDKTSPWDGPKKQRCTHVGFDMSAKSFICIKHFEPIGTDDEGWQTCCKSCTQPIQEKSE